MTTSAKFLLIRCENWIRWENSRVSPRFSLWIVIIPYSLFWSLLSSILLEDFYHSCHFCRCISLVTPPHTCFFSFFVECVPKCWGLHIGHSVVSFSTSLSIPSHQGHAVATLTHFRCLNVLCVLKHRAFAYSGVLKIPFPAFIFGEFAEIPWSQSQILTSQFSNPNFLQKFIAPLTLSLKVCD